MADDKIKANEILEDSELEEVAGGNGWETQRDADALRAIGCLTHRRVDKDQINDAFYDLGLGIGTELHNGEAPNKYFIDNRRVTREELWDYIHHHYRRHW